MTTLRDISIIWTLVHVLVLFGFLFESRCSRKKTLLLTLLCMGPLAVLNALLFIKLGPAKLGQLLILTCVLPSLMFFYFMAKQRDGRFLFTFCLADTISLEVLVLTCLLDYYLGGNKYILMFISRLVIFPVLELLAWKHLRHPYLELQHTVKKGWGTFSVVSIVFYVLLLWVSCVPDLITARPDDVPTALMILILMPLMYTHIFQVLEQQHRLYKTEEESRILRLQSDMLTKQSARIKEVEDKLRIDRHDLRHQLQTAAALVQKGEAEAALNYLTQTEASLDEGVPHRWCANPVLDAVFAAYFQQAAAAGIQVEADLAIADELPIDPAELSTVFANALENAIHACMELPEAERRIRCKCLSSPQFMFQISNPYMGEILCDKNGRPVSAKPGHGIGTRSIAAFCEKHDAHCEYKMENNMFSLRILVLE